MTEFSRVTGNKVNIQKLIAFMQTSHEQSDNEQNVMKVVQNLYCDNYKVLWKETKD